MNSDWLGAIVLFKFKDNLIVQGDFGQKMKACSANWRLFTIGFLVQRRIPERGFSELNLLTAVFFIYPLVGGGGEEKHVYNLHHCLSFRWQLICYFFFFNFLFFFPTTKHNIYFGRKQSLIVNNWFNTVSSKVELSLCLSRRSWLHLLTLISHRPAASPSHRSRGRRNQNNDPVLNLTASPISSRTHMHTHTRVVRGLCRVQSCNLMLQRLNAGTQIATRNKV